MWLFRLIFKSLADQAVSPLRRVFFADHAVKARNRTASIKKITRAIPILRNGFIFQIKAKSVAM